jgi:hypothetical protein
MSSQITYDLAWYQQIDKEFCAAEISRGSNQKRTGIAPHVIAGYIPVDNRFQQQKMELCQKTPHPQYSSGIPLKTVFTRRNNMQALLKLRDQANLSNVSAPISPSNQYAARESITIPVSPTAQREKHNQTQIMVDKASPRDELIPLSESFDQRKREASMNVRHSLNLETIQPREELMPIRNARLR